jgi:Bacterial Ig-like domain (group 3)/MBG domain (YGX type)/IPT/TIG domain
MTYGSTIPALTAYTPTGFQNSETASVLSGTPILSTTATSTSDVGNYPISIATGSLSAPNYSFTFVGGTMTVLQTVPTLTLTTSNASISFGMPVTFTAMLPASATGTVFFKDSGTTLGTGAMLGSSATFTTSSLPAGLHAITATYSGESGDYYESSSVSLTQMVTQTALGITTTSLPDGTQNVLYTPTLQASGGQPPYSWSMPTGNVPGLILVANGSFSGMPTAPGTINFTVRVTDAAFQTVSAPFSLRINPAEAALQIANLTPASGLPGTIVTVSGSSFGASQAESLVVFNNSAVPVLQWSNNAIVFAVPLGIGTGSVQVRVMVSPGDNSWATFTVLGDASCVAN